MRTNKQRQALAVEFNSPRCPRCRHGFLEHVSGDFSTGVVAPDGVQEMRPEQFYECDRCGRKFDVSDIERGDDEHRR